MTTPLPYHYSRDPVEIERVIASYRGTLMSDEDWLVAGDFVRRMVRQTAPVNVNAAQARLSMVSRYLLTCSMWRRDTPPEQAEVFSDAQIRYVDAALRVNGVGEGVRSITRTVARKLRTELAPARKPAPPKLPIVWVPNVTLTARTTMPVVYSWLLARLSGPIDLKCLDKALREVAGRSTGLTPEIIWRLLPHLPCRDLDEFVPEFVRAVVPVVARSVSPKPKFKPPSRAAIKRAQQGKKAGVSTRATLDSLSPEIVAAIEKYEPKLPRQDWDRVRTVVRGFVAASQPISPKSAIDLMWMTTRYALWAHSHAGVSPITVDVLADQTLFRRYITTGTKGVAESTIGTVRSQLANGISIIIEGPKQKVGYRKGAAPYTRADEARLILLARHQTTVLRRARLGAVVALGAGAGLNSAELRGVLPGHITEQTRDGVSLLQVEVVAGVRPRTVPVRDTYRELLSDALRWHQEGGFSPTDPLTGSPTARNVVGRIADDCLNADGSRPNVDAFRLRSTWLLAIVNARVPLTAILAAAGLKTPRPIVDLIPYLEEPDPAEFALVIAGVGS